MSPNTVPTTAMEMSHEPSGAALFSPLLQQSQYWRYLADAHKDMAHEGFQELLHSLGPRPQPLQQLQSHPPLPQVHGRPSSPPCCSRPSTGATLLTPTMTCPTRSSRNSSTPWDPLRRPCSTRDPLHSPRTTGAPLHLPRTQQHPQPHLQPANVCRLPCTPLVAGSAPATPAAPGAPSTGFQSAAGIFKPPLPTAASHQAGPAPAARQHQEPTPQQRPQVVTQEARLLATKDATNLAPLQLPR